MLSNFKKGWFWLLSFQILEPVFLLSAMYIIKDNDVYTARRKRLLSCSIICSVGLVLGLFRPFSNARDNFANIAARLSNLLVLGLLHCL